MSSNELERENKHTTGGPNWGPAKNLEGHGHPRSPLIIANGHGDISALL